MTKNILLPSIEVNASRERVRAEPDLRGDHDQWPFHRHLSNCANNCGVRRSGSSVPTVIEIQTRTCRPTLNRGAPCITPPWDFHETQTSSSTACAPRCKTHCTRSTPGAAAYGLSVTISQTGCCDSPIWYPLWKRDPATLSDSFLLESLPQHAARRLFIVPAPCYAYLLPMHRCLRHRREGVLNRTGLLEMPATRCGPRPRICLSDPHAQSPKRRLQVSQA